MAEKSTIITEIFFKDKVSRDYFIKLINEKADWKYTAHGDVHTPNSLYVKLYHINQKDLNMLNAMLFAVEVGENNHETTSDNKPIPKRESRGD